ncbi:hypothetical protein PINS_up020756 [Pythium insidiosum]|nr:hypothetical protein PINS_up020756 [Pythium insidiosum]
MVFDECHHVTKRHPYAQIVKLFDAAERSPGETGTSLLPRIFGTTACPTQHTASHLHAELFHVKMEEKETVEFAAAAPLLLELYGDTTGDTEQFGIGRINEAIKRAVQISAQQTPNITVPLTDVESVEQWMETSFRGTPLERLLTELEDLKAVQVLRKLLMKGRSSAAHDPLRREKLVRKFVLTASEMFQNLGLWCFYRFVELEMERCAINALLLLYVPGSMYGFDADAVKTIMMARGRRCACTDVASLRLQKIESVIQRHIEDEDNSRNSFSANDNSEEDGSDSIDGNSELSADSSSYEGDDEGGRRKRLQGIVFVNTRIEARIVCEYLNDTLGGQSFIESRKESVHDDEDDGEDEDLERFQIIPKRFATILGQALTRDTASFNLPKMSETLTHFEVGDTQFLVSTAVSIEGVDFPQCSLIVVADRIQTPRMLIQLRGRARHEDGVVYYLVKECDLDHLLHFQALIHRGNAINDLDFRHDKPETVLQQPRAKAAGKLEGMEFFPDESKIVLPETGATLDLDSSMACLNMFCQALPTDLFTVDFKGMFTFESVEVRRKPMFRATLRLPPELEVEPFVSKLLHSKGTAKAAAAFAACRHLLEIGYLDSSLNSVYRKGKNKGIISEENIRFFLNRLRVGAT